MSFIDGLPHRVDKELERGFQNVKKPLRCGYCGHHFVLDEYIRWIYTNDTPGAGGNPFTCSACDTGDSTEMVEKYRQLRIAYREAIDNPAFWSFQQ